MMEYRQDIFNSMMDEATDVQGILYLQLRWNNNVITRYNGEVNSLL